MNYFDTVHQLLNHPCNKAMKIKALIRILWWKINQMLFHIPGIVQVTPEAQCICYTTSSYGGLVIYTKLPEYAEMSLVYRILRRDDTFIDVGANIGTYSLIAGSKINHPNGKVYAFEPTESTLTILMRNVLLNDFKQRIEVIPELVSDIDGVEKFVFCKEADVNHIAYVKHRNDQNVKEIKAIKLDSFCSAVGLRYIDMVKIDVEGAEYKVLKGFESYLAHGKVGLLLIELNAHSKSFGIDPDRVLSFLKDRGYKLYRFGDGYRLYQIYGNRFHVNKPTNIIAAHRSDKAISRICEFAT